MQHETTTLIAEIRHTADQLLSIQSQGGDSEHAFWLHVDAPKLGEALEIMDTQLDAMKDELDGSFKS